jgi:4'-phosphopantetheinyl transferase
MSSHEIWVVPFDSAKLTPQNISYLNQIEKDKANSFIHQKDKQNYQLSHIYLREILSSYYPNIHPQEWVFYNNKFGKPYIKDFDIYFNISHTSNYFAMIVSYKECGIDIEQNNTIQIDTDILDLTLTAKEQMLHKTEHISFYTFWTLKEAHLKAIGKGLFTQPNTIEFLSAKQDTIFTQNGNIYKTQLITPNLYLSCAILDSKESSFKIKSL